MDSCLFCGTAAGDLTIEDVIPKWAVRAFAIQGPVTIAAIDQPGSERRQAGRPMRALKVTLEGALCAPCNNGWLGGSIEKRMARLVAPMATRRAPAVLDAATQRLVAFWAVKTVLLLEFAIRQMHPGEREVEGYAPSAVGLAHTRARSEPPPRAMVWLGCYDCEMSKPRVHEARQKSLAPLATPHRRP